MTKLEELKAAMAERDAATNGVRWQMCQDKVRELTYVLMPALLEAVAQRQKLIEVLEGLPDSIKSEYGLYSLVTRLEGLE